MNAGSFPLTLEIEFQVSQNCCFSFQGAKHTLFSYILCGIPRWALLFGMGQRAMVEHSLLDCRSFLQDEWLPAVRTCLSDSSGSRYSLPL